MFLKAGIVSVYNAVKGAEGMANTVDPDQIAPNGAV